MRSATHTPITGGVTSNLSTLPEHTLPAHVYWFTLYSYFDWLAHAPFASSSFGTIMVDMNCTWWVDVRAK